MDTFMFTSSRELSELLYHNRGRDMILNVFFSEFELKGAKIDLINLREEQFGHLGFRLASVIWGHTQNQALVELVFVVKDDPNA